MKKLLEKIPNNLIDEFLKKIKDRFGVYLDSTLGFSNNLSWIKKNQTYGLRQITSEYPDIGIADLDARALIYADGPPGEGAEKHRVTQGEFKKNNSPGGINYCVALKDCVVFIFNEWTTFKRDILKKKGLSDSEFPLLFYLKQIRDRVTHTDAKSKKKKIDSLFLSCADYTLPSFDSGEAIKLSEIDLDAILIGLKFLIQDAVTFMSKFPLFPENIIAELQDDLHYLKVAELKEACMLLGLPEKGKKPELVKRILAFIQDGRIIPVPKMPAQSLAKNYPKQPLAPSSLMLYGSYKNDLKARIFFKQLIGLQFHFTAYGIDWLRERWLQGNPPTYQEFADYWVKETEQRKREKPKPKDEWMFIRFMQKMEKEKPNMSQEELLEAWKLLQAEKARHIFDLLNKVKESL